MTNVRADFLSSIAIFNVQMPLVRVCFWLLKDYVQYSYVVLPDFGIIRLASNSIHLLAVAPLILSCVAKFE